MIWKPICLDEMKNSPTTQNQARWPQFHKACLMAFGFAVAIIAAPAPAFSSQNLSASDVLDACGRANEAWVSFCHGYMQATFDLSRFVGFDICPPEGTTRAMMAQTVYLGLVFISEQTSAEDMQQADGATLSAEIMAIHYPCD